MLNWKSTASKLIRRLTAAFLGALLSLTVYAETVGERFDRFIKAKTAYCAKHTLLKGETTCDILKLKPSDPLTTPEGRYAHSIKIPNPVPEDSGYRNGMTSREYFEHLCRTEAGEFIFKKMENVDGVLQMRPRRHASDKELEHLYALEDPYGHTNTEADHAEDIFVDPVRYKYFDVPQIQEGGEPMAIVKRFYGYDGRRLTSMRNVELSESSIHYGFTWRGIRRPYDRELGIAGGELIVLDVTTKEILGIRRGFIRTGNIKNSTGVWWLTGQTCPQYGLRGGRNKDFDFLYWFVGKVLRPAKYEESFKELINGR